jgi:hypothetical protein
MTQDPPWTNKKARAASSPSQITLIYLRSSTIYISSSQAPTDQPQTNVNVLPDGGLLLNVPGVWDARDNSSSMCAKIDSIECSDLGVSRSEEKTA